MRGGIQHNWGTARVHCGWNGEITWSQGLINKTMLILSSLPQKMSFGGWKGKVQGGEHICNMFFQWKDCCPICVCVCLCVCKLEKEMATYFSIFCLGNPMGEEPGGFAKSLTWLSDQTTIYIYKHSSKEKAENNWKGQNYLKQLSESKHSKGLWAYEKMLNSINH